MMIASDHKDTRQRRYEASVKCLRSEGPTSTPQCNEGSPELRDGTHDQPGGDVINPDCLSDIELLEPSREYTHGPIYHHDLVPRASWPDPNTVSLCPLNNAFRAQVHPVALNYGFQYMPVSPFPRNHAYDYRFQDYQYFVVIDFEATCDREKNPHPQEIIEFPSVIVSSVTGQLEACFQTYVRPTCNQVLTDFCKDLTGIQQIQVERGVTLGEALFRHDKWLEKKGIKKSNFAVVTWSNWDCRVMLESECRYKKIGKPSYFNRWINLKVPFQEVFGGVGCNLKKAVETAGLEWQGRAHCGLDDAKNTARLLALIMRKGFKFSITNSLACQTDGDLFSSKPTHEKPMFISPHYWKLPELRTPPPPQIHRYCYCGVTSSKGVVRKPGPKQGSIFFGCGNWNVARGARCNYFEWASS